MKNAVQVLVLILLTLALLSGFTAFGMWQYGWVLPWQYKIEREAVKQSESFTNSSNIALSGMITQYNGLDISINNAKASGAEADGYVAQQKAILNQMCMQISTMNLDTVNPNVSSFVQAHGGCR